MTLRSRRKPPITARKAKAFSSPKPSFTSGRVPTARRAAVGPRRSSAHAASRLVWILLAVLWLPNSGSAQFREAGTSGSRTGSGGFETLPIPTHSLEPIASRSAARPQATPANERTLLVQSPQWQPQRQQHTGGEDATQNRAGRMSQPQPNHRGTTPPVRTASYLTQATTQEAESPDRATWSAGRRLDDTSAHLEWKRPHIRAEDERPQRISTQQPVPWRFETKIVAELPSTMGSDVQMAGAVQDASAGADEGIVLAQNLRELTYPLQDDASDTTDLLQDAPGAPAPDELFRSLRLDPPHAQPETVSRRNAPSGSTTAGRLGPPTTNTLSTQRTPPGDLEFNFDLDEPIVPESVPEERLPEPSDRSSASDVADENNFDDSLDGLPNPLELLGDKKDDSKTPDGSPEPKPATKGELSDFNDRDCAKLGETCRTNLSRLNTRERTRINLNITPSIEPREFDMAKVEQVRAEKLAKVPNRVWRDPKGNVLATGQLDDYRDGRVYVLTANGTVQNFKPKQLCEEDFCFLNAWWELPPECRFADEPYVMRDFRLTTFTWAASAACHKPLYFEDVNLERYGHDAGPFVQPVLSGAHFFGNVALLPYHMGLNPPNECLYQLGYYRPGSCAPWLIHGFPWSTRGFKWEGLALGAAIALLP